ncbi:MAG TPA: hypothetical protein VM848_14945 [Acidimicrobiia bacterium]|nr:hypothetical protein [Acidimicrobiia bacterium]
MTGHRALSLPVLGLALVIVACGGGGAATTADTTATTAAATTTATSAADTTTTADATTITVEATTTTAANDCPAAAEPASGWRLLETPDWVSYYPADWEDVSTRVPTEAKTAGWHFDAVTLAEAGVDESEVLVSYAVASFDFQQNLLILQLDGPTSSLEDIYQRAEERYRESTDFEEMIAAGVADCLGGEPAIHVGFMTAGSYQQSWFSLRAGTLFHADFFGVTADDAAVVAELLAAWEWTEPTADIPSDAFLEVVMADEVDTSVDAPDPAWYTDEFTTASSAVYVVYRLPDGTTGTVNATWSSEGTELLTYDFFYEADHTWAYMAITPPAGGFSAGDYQVELVLDDDVARIVLEFTITEG